MRCRSSAGSTARVDSSRKKGWDADGRCRNSPLPERMFKADLAVSCAASLLSARFFLSLFLKSRRWWEEGGVLRGGWGAGDGCSSLLNFLQWLLVVAAPNVARGCENVGLCRRLAASACVLPRSGYRLVWTQCLCAHLSQEEPAPHLPENTQTAHWRIYAGLARGWRGLARAACRRGKVSVYSTEIKLGSNKQPATVPWFQAGLRDPPGLH